MVDARIGSAYLFAAFAFQLVDLFATSTICDLDLNPIGGMAAVAFSGVIFMASLWLSRFYGLKYTQAITAALTKQPQ